MKSFLVNICVFIFILCCIIGTGICISNKIIDNGNYFKIKDDTRYMVLGHSQPECAFNDSLIPGLKNYAQSGEAYFYSFLKLKKIIESNRKIEAVFIAYSNNQIDKEMNKWTWGDEYLLDRYPKYAPLMTFNEIIYLFVKNPKVVISSQSLSLKRNLFFILNNDTNFISYENWGGYNYLIRDKTDSLIKAFPKNAVMNYYEETEISDLNIKYLAKMVEFCNDNGVKVYLMRCPIYAQYQVLSNDLTYKKILKEKFPNTDYFDFIDFPLQNSEYGDFIHLNYKGAKKFSGFFNRLLTHDLLSIKNKQELINLEIEKVKVKDPVTGKIQ